MKMGALQLKVLAQLSYTPEGLTVNQMVERTGRMKMSVNRALLRLMDEGLVKRESVNLPNEARWTYLYKRIVPADHSWQNKAIETATERLTAAGAEPLDILSLQTLIDSNPEVFVEIAAIIEGVGNNEA